MSKKKYFIDTDFPHNGSSLIEEDKDTDVEWIRLEEILGDEAQLFGDEIHPNDICQGSLGNCWVISAIAALSEFPDLIQNLFITEDIPPDGKYKLWLFNTSTNEWEEVVIDSYIPCVDKTPLYAMSNGNKMWPVLLEKAIAKFGGSYRTFGSKILGHVFPNLTGMSTIQLSSKYKKPDRWYKMTVELEESSCIADFTDESYSLEELFELISEHDQAENIMSCNSAFSSGEEKNGIVGSHEYSLLNVAQVEGFQLFNLRNPWGHGEWKGDWSDESDMWNSYPEVKETLNFVPKDDGSFWISLEDFSIHFSSIVICIRDEEFQV